MRDLRQRRLARVFARVLRRLHIQQQGDETMTTTSNRPVDRCRMGAVTVAIWQNEGAKGRPIYNASVERLYRDQETGDWKTSTSFGRDDLLNLAKAADMAHTRIHELQTLDRVTKEKRDAESPSTGADDPANEDEQAPENAASPSISNDQEVGPTPTRSKAKAKARGAEKSR